MQKKKDPSSRKHQSFLHSILHDIEKRSIGMSKKIPRYTKRVRDIGSSVTLVAEKAGLPLRTAKGAVDWFIICQSQWPVTSKTYVYCRSFLNNSWVVVNRNIYSIPQSSALSCSKNPRNSIIISDVTDH